MAGADSLRRIGESLGGWRSCREDRFEFELLKYAVRDVRWLGIDGRSTIPRSEADRDG